MRVRVYVHKNVRLYSHVYEHENEHVREDVQNHVHAHTHEHSQIQNMCIIMYMNSFFYNVFRATGCWRLRHLSF
jgi:hypothetical protein